MKKLIAFTLVIFILFGCSNAIGEAKKCKAFILPNLSSNASEYMESSHTRALAAAIFILEINANDSIETQELCQYFFKCPSYIGRSDDIIILMGTNEEDSIILIGYKIGDKEIYYDYMYGKYDAKDLQIIAEGIDKVNFYQISIGDLTNAIHELSVLLGS